MCGSAPSSAQKARATRGAASSRTSSVGATLATRRTTRTSPPRGTRRARARSSSSASAVWRKSRATVGTTTTSRGIRRTQDASRRASTRSTPAANGPDSDLSANADFVELFVPFSEDDESDGDESVDSADLDGDEVDATGSGTEEPETAADAGDDVAVEDDEPYVQEPDVSYRREERDYEEFEDDDAEEMTVVRLLTR